MRRYAFAWLGLVLAMACTVAVAREAQNSAAQTAQDQTTRPEAGKVMSVDTAKSEIAIKDDKGVNQTLRVSSDTKITKNGREITLAEIKADDRVLFEYDE